MIDIKLCDLNSFFGCVEATSPVKADWLENMGVQSPNGVYPGQKVNQCKRICLYKSSGSTKAIAKGGREGGTEGISVVCVVRF